MAIDVQRWLLFWAKVNKNGPVSAYRTDLGPCWLWTAGTKKNEGYGDFWDGNRTVGAHVQAYLWLKGVIPAKQTLDHLCRVRRCVHPSHLEAVTNKQNLLRGMGAAAIQARKTHCNYGHPLTGTNVRIVKRRDCDERVCRICHAAHCKDQRRRAALSAPASGQPSDACPECGDSVFHEKTCSRGSGQKGSA